MTFKIEEATRVGIIPLLALWGGTGGGKTESALRLGRGMAGTNGTLGVIDTEGRRASYYVDRIPGGFKVINFKAPYPPERYIEALDMAEEAWDVTVVDSGTHCWEGPDGILDLHEQMLDRMLRDRKDDYKERERMNYPAWREPKERWKPLRDRLLSFSKPLILCFRGQCKTRMVKGEDGRNTVVTDTTTTPIFEPKFIFEVHVAMEVFQIDGKGGFVRFPMPYAKTSHADIRRMLPEEGKEQLSIEHGARIMQWSRGETSAPAASQPVKTADPRKDLFRTLWDLTAPIHQTPPGSSKEVKAHGRQVLEQWITDEVGTPDNKTLEALSVEELSGLITKIETKLAVK